MARCSRCKTKDKTEFNTYKNKKGEKVYQTYCKTCSLDYYREWAKKNKDKVKKSKKKYYDKLRNDPIAWTDYLRRLALRRCNVRLSEQVYKANKRARKYEVEGKLTVKKWKRLIEDTPECPGCNEIWAFVGIPTLDHIVPMKKRGTNKIKNIQPLCRTCHAKKVLRIRRLKKRKKTK